MLRGILSLSTFRSPIRLRCDAGPALVIAAAAVTDAFAVLWVLMITSAAHEGWPLDVPISDLEAGGLSHGCVVRVSKVTSLDARLATRIGELAAMDRVKVAGSLRKLLGPVLHVIS